MPSSSSPRRRAVVLLSAALALASAAVPPAAAWALPSITVPVKTSALANFGTHRAVTITASCSSGRLVGGGSYLRNATNPATIPTNGLVLDGTMPSNSLGAPVANGTTNPASWTTVAGFSGMSEAGDQAATFAMCATSGPANTVVVTATTTGANAAEEVSPPTITTATCATGKRLVGGGAVESTPGQVNDGSTVANSGNLKPMASYPSNSTGAPSTNGTVNATSWSAYGSAGAPASTDAITAFAVCSTDAAPPNVTVRRTDSSGPNGQAGTTVTTATASCTSGRMLSGGFRVDETVSGTAGRQPQQGYHMRGSFPADASGNEVANGATNPNSWKTVLQAGGQTLGAANHMDTKTFALCSA
jgi:hypothetical protein